MEIEQNAEIVAPVEKDIEKATPPEEKGKDLWIIFLNVLLAVITIFLLAYVAYKNGYINIDNILNTKEDTNTNTNTQTTEPDSSEDTAVTEEQEAAPEVFTGTVLSAIVPSGWSIVEYLDGQGSDMMVEGVTYTGLTGIKVLNGVKQILYVKAVSGIGFIGCPELPLFPDSSATYKAEQDAMNTEVQMDMTVLDYTDTNFSEFEWFGKDFRMVNKTFYYDTIPGNNFFEPQCEKILLTVPGFSFEDSDGYKGTAYFYEINELATPEELNVLTGILASMVSI